MNESEQNSQALLVEKAMKDEIAEIVLESASSLPVIDHLVKVGKFVSGISEQIFVRKISQFLYELKDIPTNKRIEKINEINNSPKLQNSIGTVILEQLQRIDSEYKPQVLGKLFASYIEERITLEEYLRLVHIVSNSFYLDLKSIKEYSQNGLYKNKNYNGLVDSELMQIDYTEVYNAERNSNNEENYPKLTVLGNLLLEHGL